MFQYKKLFIFVILIGLLGWASIWQVRTVWAGGVVGDGTPASCTGNAVEAALASGGTVTFNCGPDPLVIAANTMVIDGIDVTLDGADLITLDEENLRQFFIVNAGASLTLAHITLAHGNWSGDGGALANYGTLTLNNSVIRDSHAEGEHTLGGGIMNYQGGLVTLNSSQILTNSATLAGGGINNSSGATLILNDSTVQGNTAGRSGGIENNGTLELHNSTIQDNAATTDNGGGIGMPQGKARLENSLVQGNSSATGGGLWTGSDANVEIVGSRFVDNHAGGNNSPNSDGGGIDNSGVMTITESTFSGNQATNGGALSTQLSVSRLLVRQSTFTGNSVTNSGGALQIADGATTLVNLTISGNSAGGFGGGVVAGVREGSLALENVTLYGNSAPTGANLYQYGSIRSVTFLPLTLRNTLLTNPSGGNNCVLVTAATSLGHNLVSDDSCALTNDGDQQNVDPLLGPLADNGGSTQTHLPQPSSPAIDAGDTAVCPAIDQRGDARPAGNGCDIGAVEVQPDAPTATPTAPDVATDTPTPTPTATGGPTPTPVVQNLILPITGFTALKYPLTFVKLIDPIKLIELSKHTIDVEICLYRADPTATQRAPYEKAIQYFADAIYEMTNGAHIIKNVTFIYHCTDLSSNVVWSERLWPNSTLSGYGNDVDAHVAMADTFAFPTPYAALQAGNERGTGYTLAHEWGHYMYGVNDQYANTAKDTKGNFVAPCNTTQTYQGPCATDSPVNPSVMTKQWNATGGDYTWLNFSIAKNETKQNVNWRFYQADDWTILSRSANQDPQGIYTNHIALRRNYFSELADVAPKNNQNPTIELPTNDADLPGGIARSLLKITWKDRNGSGDGIPQFKPNGDLFHYCLTCPERLNWDNLIRYPDAVLFNVNLEKQLPIARMNVVAHITAPNGATNTVPVVDSKGTGEYQVALPYQMAGVHAVQFVFTNPNHQAVFTNAGATYTAGPNGEVPPLTLEPVNQAFTITASTIFTIADFKADDHADVQAQATVLTTTNESVAGHIDRPGDIDMFTFVADRNGAFVVRITDLLIGMQPHLTITRGDGSSVFDGSFDAANGDYLLAKFSATSGERFSIAVTDAKANGQGGFYRISAGPPVESAVEQGSQVFLPLIER